MQTYLVSYGNSGVDLVDADVYVFEHGFVNFYKKTFWRCKMLASFRQDEVHRIKIKNIP